MYITLEEARALYKQGGPARTVALRAYKEEEIINDFTLVRQLPDVEHTPLTNLYAQLRKAYRQISAGRPVELTKGEMFTYLRLVFSSTKFKRRYGEYKQDVAIDGESYRLYAGISSSTFSGKLGYENDGVPCGSALLYNSWAFRDREQALHFVNTFYKELVLLELGDSHDLVFEDKYEKATKRDVG